MTIAELMSHMTVLQPDDDGYAKAAASVSGVGTPDLIVFPQTQEDVERAVSWAREHEVPIYVRGGGHSEWGLPPGGMTVNLSAFDDVTVTSQQGARARVRVGGGARWGQVARILAEHGLALSSGDTASVGVGGLTLGGGIGWMTRAWGLAIDQLVGAIIVTADGVTRHIDSVHEPELFWAVRGGGGGFGVVTAFEFAAHPLTEIVVTQATVTDARLALQSVRNHIAAAPRELTVTYMDVPAMDPSAPAGASLTMVWAGSDRAAAAAATAPLLAHGTANVTHTVMAYPDVLMEFPDGDPTQPHPAFIGGNALAAELTDDDIEHLVNFGETRPSAITLVRSMGGAVGDVPHDATAFSSRDASWLVMMGAFDIGFDDEAKRQVLESCAALNAHGALVYGNFSSDTTPDAAQTMYAATTAERLREIKTRWDPTNVFCRAHVFVE